MKRETQRRHSILMRLSRGIVGALALASVLTFGTLYLVGHSERVDAFEQAMRDDLLTISNITQVYPNDELYVNIEPEALGIYLAGGNRFFQVWEASTRKLLDRSVSLETVHHTFPHPELVANTPRRYESSLPDGRRVSLITVQTRANWGLDEEMLQRTQQTIRDRDVHLVVGRLSQELDDSLRPLIWACLGGALVLPLIAGAALAWLVPRALRPLRALGEAAASRSADTFDPFAGDGTAEIEPIVQRLNDLLQRIDTARQRERRFLDDAAHELRTPLAELHVLTDVALLGHDNAQAEVFEEIRDVTRRMTHLVEALFRMARNRRLPIGAACEQVSLSALMHDVMQTKAGLMQQRQLRWNVGDHPDVQVTVDPIILRALLDNLAVNAASHACAGSTIDVRWSGGHMPSLRITNRCPRDVEEAHTEHLGYGLTLATAYAQALQLTLTTQRHGENFEAVVAWTTPTVPPPDACLPCFNGSSQSTPMPPVANS